MAMSISEALQLRKGDSVLWNGKKYCVDYVKETRHKSTCIDVKLHNGHETTWLARPEELERA